MNGEVSSGASQNGSLIGVCSLSDESESEKITILLRDCLDFLGFEEAAPRASQDDGSLKSESEEITAFLRGFPGFLELEEEYFGFSIDGGGEKPRGLARQESSEDEEDEDS